MEPFFVLIFGIPILIAVGAVFFGLFEGTWGQ